jgi:hypothetical protein
MEAAVAWALAPGRRSGRRGSSGFQPTLRELERRWSVLVGPPFDCANAEVSCAWVVAPEAWRERGGRNPEARHAAHGGSALTPGPAVLGRRPNGAAPRSRRRPRRHASGSLRDGDCLARACRTPRSARGAPGAHPRPVFLNRRQFPRQVVSGSTELSVP